MISEQQFLQLAKIGCGGDGDEMREAVDELLRSIGYEDARRALGDIYEDVARERDRLNADLAEAESSADRAFETATKYSEHLRALQGITEKALKATEAVAARIREAL